MSNITARTKDHIITSSLRRGFEEITIVLDRDKDILPPTELTACYQSRLAILINSRIEIWISLGRPNKVNIKKWVGRIGEHNKSELLQLYFDVGATIYSLQNQLKEINVQTKSLVPLGQIFNMNSTETS